MEFFDILDTISQIGIGVFGLTAIFLANLNIPKYTRWAPVVGLLSQPFWFYTTFINEQWGIFLMAFVYTGFWSMGCYNYWFKK